MQPKRDCPKIKYDEEQVILPILVDPSSPVDISSPLLPPHYFYPPSPYLSFLSQLYYRNRGLLPGKYNELPYSSLSKDEPAHSYVAHRLVHQEEGKLKAIKNSTSSTLMTSTDICPRRFIDTHTFQLVEFGENSVIPPYAILSHTWTKGEEIVYEEFTHPRGETFSKQGYRKILAACQQAHQDGIHYIWVDTCCIEQGNHADVAVNIMSMYAYYQNAEVCYAYLADVVHDAVMSL
ncbi:hypothetical protein VKT23_006478 [Stygiomarasmius scandens]|uniref:Heterokaryon incompatibility domain-containing protein n=1 Tax=Marasmiellus scandens TaxID=2682957 RepID=A0ABR1JS95_9AGAR